MKIKVYNENGKVKISKIAPSGVEQVMFSDLQPGRVAEIEVECYTSYSTAINSSPKKEKWCDQCHAKDDCKDREEFLASEEAYCVSYA